MIANPDRKISVSEISYSQEVYRKLIHLSSIWMSFAIFFLPRNISIPLFFFCMIGNIVFEYGYCKKWPFFFAAYNLFFGKMMRFENENKKFKLSGSPFVFAAAFICSLLFQKDIGATAFAIMIIGDTAAALIGRKFGKIKFSNSKSLEGLLSFIISSVAVLLICSFLFDFLYLKIIYGVVGVFIAGIFELYSKALKIDDNFSIPLIIGIALSMY